MHPQRRYQSTTAARAVSSMVRRHRPRSAVGALGTIFLAAVGARVALNWGPSTPWIAPDEMLYALLGESMWSGRLEVLGQPSGYYGL